METPNPAAIPGKTPIFAIVTLDEPIERPNAEPIKEVRVRKPDAGTLRGLKLVDVINVDVNAMVQLLPRITEPVLHQPTLNAMNVSDFVALSNEVALFLPQKGEITDSPAE